MCHEVKKEVLEDGLRNANRAAADVSSLTVSPLPWSLVRCKNVTMILDAFGDPIFRFPPEAADCGNLNFAISVINRAKE